MIREIIQELKLEGKTVFLTTHNIEQANLTLLKLWFTKEEVLSWLRATWQSTLLILPWLLLGVFAAGIIKVILPPEVIQTWVGGNSLMSNLIASVSGALMYFATLTEVEKVQDIYEEHPYMPYTR